jgi:transposase
MPKKIYVVNLDDAEREQLQQLLRSGSHPSRKLTRARILLKAAEGCTDQEIAAALGAGRATVERTRESFVERGLGALNERPRPGKKPKLDVRAKARLIAEACSHAPTGQARWTMRLLADRLVELQVVETISDETVRRALKKTSSSPG